MRRPAILLTGLTALACAGTAPALGSPGDLGGEPGEPGTRAGAAVSTQIAVRSATGIVDGGRRYVMSGQPVLLEGGVRTYAAEQVVSLELTRGARRVTEMRAAVRRSGEGGTFSARFTPRRPGTYRLRASLATGSGAPEPASKPVTMIVVSPRARPGSSGLGVRLLQGGLARLGYVTSRGGRYDAATGRAVIAYRKANRMARTPRTTRAVFRGLFAGRGAFRLRYPRAGKHVEFDWSRQVLVLARAGRVERVYHVSSGAPATPTVFGSFRFYRKQPGTNAKGMVHSNYFIRGYAIHGFSSVPTRPASHGCIRVPIPNARSIDRWLRLGDRIVVYR